MKTNKTESSFITNTQLSENEGNSINKTELQTDISVTLYDIDYAIKYYIDSKMKPTVIENEKEIPVPCIYSNGEKWAMFQKYGFIRDNQGKLLTPLIMLKRNSTTRRDSLIDMPALETPENRIVLEQKYTKDNRYDRFSTTKKQPPRELYSLDVPKYITVEYDINIWTNNTIQLNHLVELMIWHSGKAWGDTYKFTTQVENPVFDTMNMVGEDRIVRASLQMTSNGYILLKDKSTSPLYKLNPASNFKISIKEQK